MAVKTSGQLSLRYDIAAEVNGDSSNIRLRTLSSAAGFGTPDRMSEFYGYSAVPPNDFYWQNRNAWLGNTTAAPISNTMPLGATMMGWFLPNVTTSKNQLLFSIGGDIRSQRGGAFRATYQANLNRIQLAVWDSTGTRRVRREYPLHDNPTGVSNSRSGWRRDQPGTLVDPSGLIHIAATWNGTANANSLQLYWNGAPLLNSVNNDTSAIDMSNQVFNSFIAFGNSHWQGNNLSIFDGSMDNPFFFNYLVAGPAVGGYFNNVGNAFATAYDSWNGPNPFYAQGFEASGDLNQEVINQFNHNPVMQGGANFQFLPYP